MPRCLPDRSAPIFAAFVAIACALACGPVDRPRTSEPQAKPAAVPVAAQAPSFDAGSLLQRDPLLGMQAYSTIDNWSTMRALELGPASLPRLLNKEWLGAIQKQLTKQVRDIARRDSNAGVGIRGNIHRLFNTRWLAEGHFELTGLTYRVERIAVDPTRCGDIRLIYRLAYKTELSGEQVHSRLPMTLLVELASVSSEAGGCQAEAKKWIGAEGLRGKALANFLLGGALRGRISPDAVVQVLVNVQIVRWPSAVRPSLGGHAEYSMLAFAPNADRSTLVPRSLENTPNLRALRSPEKRRALLSWIGDNLAAIDNGSAILPETFLAQDAVSVSPRGLSRRANRPFRQLFHASDFSSLALAEYQRIASPEALLRRLDDMTCVGCHQSRTIAGFHWLGEDGPLVAPGNALYVSRSVPLQGDARRRDRILLDLASARTPKFSRPFAARDDDDPGIVGSHCGLGDPGFQSWTCQKGLRCDVYDAPVDDAVTGVCASEGAAGQGEACQVVALTAESNPHRDRAKGATMRTCEAGVCNINRTGFPGGMCTSGCEDLPDDGTCGVIALLTPFNNCLARKTPFPTCLQQHVSPAGLRACDPEHPCRDDYVCAKTPSGQGGCIPPYFLFQLRVDGHP